MLDMFFGDFMMTGRHLGKKRMLSTKLCADQEEYSTTTPAEVQGRLFTRE